MSYSCCISMYKWDQNRFVHKSHHCFIFTIRAAVGIHQGILGFSSKMVDPSFSSQKTAFKNAGAILPGFGWEILLKNRPSIGYPQFSDNCWECDLWGIASHFHEQNAQLSDWKQCQHTFATTSHGEYGIICFGCDFIGLPTMGAIVDTTGKKNTNTFHPTVISGVSIQFRINRCQFQVNPIHNSRTPN